MITITLCLLLINAGNFGINKCIGLTVFDQPKGSNISYTIAEVGTQQTPGHGCWSIKKLLTGCAELRPNWFKSDWNNWHEEHTEHHWLPQSLQVGASYCDKASLDLSLNQCHDDLRVVINLYVPNNFLLSAGPQCNPRLKPVCSAKNCRSL